MVIENFQKKRQLASVGFPSLVFVVECSKEESDPKSASNKQNICLVVSWYDNLLVCELFYASSSFLLVLLPRNSVLQCDLEGNMKP